jgi:hypothetical protein
MKLTFEPAPKDERENEEEAIHVPPDPQGLRIR